ncbi:MAG: hypothetical protein LBN00_08050 [Oscillospiraceae bacterium]|nr:hypothetical protein [Oscillospiraceae bacterium]
MKTKLTPKVKKLLALVLAGTIIAGTMLWGTFAWNDQTQFDLNEASGGVDHYDVTLNDAYTPVDDWKVSDSPLKKEISVTNTGAETTYVRLSLKEYLEIAKLAVTASTERYATDPDTGEFYVWTDGAIWTFGEYTDTITGATSIGYIDNTGAGSQTAPTIDTTNIQSWLDSIDYSDNSYEFVADFATGQVGYFVVADDSDINGVYGKHAINANAAAAESVVAGVTRAPKLTDADFYNPLDIQTGTEFAYTPYYFGAVLPDPTYYPIREYVQWNATNAPVKLTDFLASPSTYAGGVWLYDDVTGSPAQNYVYWSEPLAAGDTTAKVLDTVELIKQPEGPFYYALHVDLEAISEDALVKWTGVDYQVKYVALPGVLYDYWTVPAAAPVVTKITSQAELKAFLIAGGVGELENDIVVDGNYFGGSDYGSKSVSLNGNGYKITEPAPTGAYQQTAFPFSNTDYAGSPVVVVIENVVVDLGIPIAGYGNLDITLNNVNFKSRQHNAIEFWDDGYTKITVNNSVLDGSHIVGLASDGSNNHGGMLIEFNGCTFTTSGTNPIVDSAVSGTSSNVTIKVDGTTTFSN